MLRGGPALRWHDFFEASPRAPAATPRDAPRSAPAPSTPGPRDDDSRSTELQGQLNLRLSNRLSLSGQVSYEQLTDNLQYVATADAGPARRRYVLGRIDQDTWDFTFRVNLALTPELTLQYYGSPFIGTGRYTELQAGDRHARAGLRGPLPPVRRRTRSR